MRNLVFIAGLAVWFLGCQGKSSQPQVAESKARAEVESQGEEKAGVIYSFIDEHGNIRMAADRDDIPIQFRDRVQLTDTSVAHSERVQADRVWVVDLREDRGDKPLNYTLVDLRALLDRPSGDVRLQAEPKTPEELAQSVFSQASRSVRQWLGLAAAPESAGVILYVAPWCGFCKKAKEHLRARRVAFEEKDIERNRQAALELTRKLKAAGLSDAGVPVLDIGGTLVIGFNPEKIDRLLKNPR